TDRRHPQPDPLADPCGIHPGADRLDHPGAVLVRDLEAVYGPRDGTGPGLVIGRVDAGGVHPDQNLARTRLGPVHLLDLQDLGRLARAPVQRCSHGCSVASPPDGVRGPGAAGLCPALVESPVMEQRVLGRTGRPVSVVGLGPWQLGADWGDVSEDDAMKVLRTAVESGITLVDTADVYGDGRSERIIGRFLSGNAGQGVMVATKMGRRVEQKAEHYTLDNFRAWTDRSRVNLGVDRLDLVQLHCPPTAVFASDAVFDALDTLVTEDRIAAYGVSVETCDQALTAIARPGVASVQIIMNAFRRKPLDQVLPA